MKTLRNFAVHNSQLAGCLTYLPTLSMEALISFETSWTSIGSHGFTSLMISTLHNLQCIIIVMLFVSYNRIFSLHPWILRWICKIIMATTIGSKNYFLCFHQTKITFLLRTICFRVTSELRFLLLILEWENNGVASCDMVPCVFTSYYSKPAWINNILVLSCRHFITRYKEKIPYKRNNKIPSHLANNKNDEVIPGKEKYMKYGTLHLYCGFVIIWLRRCYHDEIINRWRQALIRK
jgi:hypothetical protein